MYVNDPAFVPVGNAPLADVPAANIAPPFLRFLTLRCLLLSHLRFFVLFS